MTTKVILVNAQALEAKYGGGMGEVWDAVDRLIRADEARGIETLLVKVDEDTGPVGAAAVTDPADWLQAKAAVDEVFNALTPDYILLLGGPDTLPHYELDNPARTDEDEDEVVPSDLPYACDAPPGSRRAGDFLAPTRVVTRLPDVPGTDHAEVLLLLLGFAAGWQSRDRTEYDAYLGVSAEVWESSTRSTLTQIYGNDIDTQVSPTDGPTWSAALMGRRSHLFNLHGANSSPDYSGQRGGVAGFPKAHQAALVDGNLAEGTVAAAEACYGAELYEPIDDDPVGMPFAYLRSGAYAFFGSTKIAYGPPVGNDWADVICSLFQSSILSGASIGRAGLEARQEYVARSAPLDPLDLKTIAEFIVLGDPSVQPVASAVAPVKAAAVLGHGLSARRERLRAMGEALGQTTAWAQPVESQPDEGVIGTLLDMAGVPDGGQATVTTFELRGEAEQQGLMYAFAKEPSAEEEISEEQQAEPATMHLLMQTIEPPGAPIPQHVAVLALEEGGQLISLKTAVSK